MQRVAPVAQWLERQVADLKVVSSSLPGAPHIERDPTPRDALGVVLHYVPDHALTTDDAIPGSVLRQEVAPVVADGAIDPRCLLVIEVDEPR